MATILPKFELKTLFESGDLITEQTMDSLIEATYNPTLVAGSNIVISKVETPSGAIITISSTGGGGGGGGGDIVIPGQGINITPVGLDKEISINLDTSQTNLVIRDNKLTFDGIHIKDENTSIGTYRTINFIGQTVLSRGDDDILDQVNVYIPPPPFASHFDTDDGTTDGFVLSSVEGIPLRISSPTTSGNPFKTGGWDLDDELHPSYTSANGSVIFETAEQVTGFSKSDEGDATIRVDFYDGDNDLLTSYTTPTIYQNGIFSNPSNTINVTIKDFAEDIFRRKANVEVEVIVGNIFSAEGYSGGRYHVEITMTTDTFSDDGLEYKFIQDDIFFDTNPTTPEINGDVIIEESSDPAEIITKHISGVEYYTTGSKFNLTVSDIDNLNANTQGAEEASEFNFKVNYENYTGEPDIQLTAWDLSEGTWNGTWTNQYDLMNADYSKVFEVSENYRYRYTEAKGSATVFDPWAIGNTVMGSPASILIDSYSDNSTSLGDSFNGELERLIRGESSYSAFNSSAQLGQNILNQTFGPLGGGNGTFCDACVVGGYLVAPQEYFADLGNSPDFNINISNLTNYKPDKEGQNPDYSVYDIGQAATYHRRFYSIIQPESTIPNFILYFTGEFGEYGNALAALEQSKLKVYIRRIARANGLGQKGSFGHGANPLAFHGSLYNSSNFNDGLSGPDTPGSFIRTTVINPNSIRGTFGTSLFLAKTGFWVEVQILDPVIKLASLNAGFIYNNGIESNIVE